MREEIEKKLINNNVKYNEDLTTEQLFELLMNKKINKPIKDVIVDEFLKKYTNSYGLIQDFGLSFEELKDLPDRILLNFYLELFEDIN